MNMNKKELTDLKLLSEACPDGWKCHVGDYVAIESQVSGRIFYGKVKLKPVKCGKPNCHKCPHHIYAYAQFRDGKKVREKYLGVAR